MLDHLVLLKPPKSPNFAVRPKGDLLAHWKAHREGLLEFFPPKIGGLGGRNHTQNQQPQKK